MDLDEPAERRDHLPDLAAGDGVGRDRGTDGDAAVLGDLAGDETDPQDVDIAMLPRKAQLAGQVLADDVAIQQRDRPAAQFQ